MLLAEIKSIFHTELEGIYPKEEVDSFFYQNIEHHLGLERFVLVMQPQFSVTKEEEEPLFEALAQLKQERPLQYILGEAHFMGMDFLVNPDVLIPRPETEELVEWILSDNGYRMSDIRTQTLNFSKPISDTKILDLGTGSGCIAIALAKNLSHAAVHALDVSKEALEVAKQNALMNQVEVTFHQQDMLQFELESELKFDIMVSNPPYVRQLEKAEMRDNVKQYEPSLALFVSDEDPLRFYRAIIECSKKSLKPNGSLYLEINQYLGAETCELLEAHNFSEIELRKDLFGNDRMIKAKRP